MPRMVDRSSAREHPAPPGPAALIAELAAGLLAKIEQSLHPVYIPPVPDRA
jgi:hypothetical protein